MNLRRLVPARQCGASGSRRRPCPRHSGQQGASLGRRPYVQRPRTLQGRVTRSPDFASSPGNPQLILRRHRHVGAHVDAESRTLSWAMNVGKRCRANSENGRTSHAHQLRWGCLEQRLIRKLVDYSEAYEIICDTYQITHVAGRHAYPLDRDCPWACARSPAWQVLLLRHLNVAKVALRIAGSNPFHGDGQASALHRGTPSESGGPDRAHNIAAACAHCNHTRHRHKRLPELSQYARAVRRRVAACRWHHQWVYDRGLLR